MNNTMRTVNSVLWVHGAIMITVIISSIIMIGEFLLLYSHNVIKDIHILLQLSI